MSPPAGVLVTDVTQSQVVVNFTTREAGRYCVVAYSAWPPDLTVGCGSLGYRHRLPLTGLRSRANYGYILARGIWWWGKGLAGARPGNGDANLMSAFPPLQTLAKDNKLNQRKTVDLLGKVVNAKGQPQGGALVVVADSTNRVSVSGMTNPVGNFSLSFPEIYLIQPVYLNIWTTDGFLSRTVFTDSFHSLAEFVVKPNKYASEE